MTAMLNGGCSLVNEGSFTPSMETVVQIIVDVDCLTGGSGGGGGGATNPTNPDTNPTNPEVGGGGVGNPNPDPVITTPLLEADKTPCQQLSKLKNNTNFTDKMTI